MTPTRELAQQINEEFKKFGRSLKVSCVYGGREYNTKKSLKRTQVLIATPGRLNDLIGKDFINVKNVSFLTLDEADQMLDMGFEIQIRKIVADIPTERQTCLFSATWKPNLQKIARDYCPKPVKINIGKYEVATNDAVEQHFIPYEKSKEHQNELVSLVMELRKKDPKSKILIFVSTKRGCGDLNTLLRKVDIKALEIHGDIDQSRREKALDQFKKNEISIMIATDVAARGLDISNISTVINFDFAKDIESYVHRIGRTGRAGKKGDAYSFISENEEIDLMFALKKILEKGNNPIPDCVKKYTDQSKFEIAQMKDRQKKERKVKIDARNQQKRQAKNQRNTNKNSKGNKGKNVKNNQKFKSLSKIK